MRVFIPAPGATFTLARPWRLPRTPRSLHPKKPGEQMKDYYDRMVRLETTPSTVPAGTQMRVTCVDFVRGRKDHLMKLWFLMDGKRVHEYFNVKLVNEMEIVDER